MEPSPWDTDRIRWLALTPQARPLKHRQHHPDARARFPEEHRLPLRPAPPFGLPWGSVPADALPETQKGERRSNPTTHFDSDSLSEKTTQADKSRAMKTGHLHVLRTVNYLRIRTPSQIFSSTTTGQAPRTFLQTTRGSSASTMATKVLAGLARLITKAYTHGQYVQVREP